MRRKDREVTRHGDLMEMVARFKVCRLGLWDGREVDILQNRPEVSFEMDGDHVLLEGDVPCRYSYAYGCVMGRGVVEFLREDEEKMHALRRIMLHQTGRDADFTPGMVRSVCVLRLKVEAVSAKLHACPEPPPSR